MSPDGVRLEGVVPSPNIWGSPGLYELENRAVDPDGVLEAAMAEIRGWEGAHVLDIGCGTGFHLPLWAERAGRVSGVEPHLPLVEAARRRTRHLSSVQVVQGVAQRIPLPDLSVDIAHARWAYFFGPGCEPGLSELRRLVRRGGAAFVIDNDATRSTFGAWFRRLLPAYDPAATERFWARQGWQRRSLDIRWEFPTRPDLEAVTAMELGPQLAEQVLAEHSGTSVDYAVNLFWRRF